MGLFDRLFKKPDAERPLTVSTTIHQDEVSPKDAPAEISRAARMSFLYKLSHSVIDEGVRGFWSGVVGSVDKIIKQMLADGTIVPASAAEKLAKMHTVPQLKEMLRSLGATPKGKKADIIDAIMAAMPAAEIDRLVGKVEYYKLTLAGQSTLDAFDQERGSARMTVEESCFNHLVAGKLQEAMTIWKSYTAKYTEGDPGSQPQGPGGTGLAASLMDESLYTDLQHSDEERAAIRAALVMRALTGSGAGVEMALDKTGGVFRCQSLMDYLRAGVCGGYARGCDPENTDLVLDLYYHTKWWGIGEQERLTGLLRDPYAKGIEIFPDQECSMSSKCKLTFGKRDLSKLPKIPRHWGCRCMYQAWVGD